MWIGPSGAAHLDTATARPASSVSSSAHAATMREDTDTDCCMIYEVVALFTYDILYLKVGMRYNLSA